MAVESCGEEDDLRPELLEAGDDAALDGMYDRCWRS